MTNGSPPAHSDNPQTDTAAGASDFPVREFIAADKGTTLIQTNSDAISNATRRPRHKRTRPFRGMDPTTPGLKQPEPDGHSATYHFGGHARQVRSRPEGPFPTARPWAPADQCPHALPTYLVGRGRRPLTRCRRGKPRGAFTALHLSARRTRWAHRWVRCRRWSAPDSPGSRRRTRPPALSFVRTAGSW